MRTSLPKRGSREAIKSMVIAAHWKMCCAQRRKGNMGGNQAWQSEIVSHLGHPLVLSWSSFGRSVIHMVIVVMVGHVLKDVVLRFGHTVAIVGPVWSLVAHRRVRR